MITIARPKKQVKSFMSDLNNIQKLHPYMLSISEIPTTGQELKKYRGVDNLPIFFYYSKKLEYEIDLVE
jgi:hypothetical protein